VNKSFCYIYFSLPLGFIKTSLSSLRLRAITYTTLKHHIRQEIFIFIYCNICHCHLWHFVSYTTFQPFQLIQCVIYKSPHIFFISSFRRRSILLWYPYIKSLNPFISNVSLNINPHSRIICSMHRPTTDAWMGVRVNINKIIFVCIFVRVNNNNKILIYYNEKCVFSVLIYPIPFNFSLEPW